MGKAKTCANLSKAFLVTLILSAAGATAGGKSLFVSTVGRDENPGTQFYPLATVQKAAQAAGAGDSIYVLPGYYREAVIIRNIKGTKERPVLIKALGEVVLEGPEEISLRGDDLKVGDFNCPLSSPEHPYYPYYRGAVVRIENCSYVTFDGFTVRDSKWFGIAGFNCDNLAVQCCTIEDTMSSGIYILDSRDVVVAFNEVIRACGYLYRHAAHGSQEFISMVNCVNFEVMYNRVHESGTWAPVEGDNSGVGGEGIDGKEHSQNGKIHHNYIYNLSRLGIYVDAWNALDNKNIEVYNNIVHDCLMGMAVGAEENGIVEGVKIYGNLFYNNRGTGLVLFSWGRNGIKKDIKIYNNTICNNEGTGINLGTELSENIEVFNNLAVKNGKSDFAAGTARGVKQGGNVFGVNPKIVDMPRTDYTLLPESPAIGAGDGNIMAGERDLIDGPRVAGKAIDAGAFEYGSKPESPRVIFVDQDGNDNSPGTISRPYATIQKAADSAVAGDSVYILPGFYRQKVVIKNKGTKDKPVVYRAVGQVIIDWPGDVTLNEPLPKIGKPDMPISNPEHLYYPYYKGAIVRVENCANIIIDGFNIRNSQWFGLAALNCEGVTIRDCLIEDTMSSGIYILNSKDVIVGYNEITRACGYPKRTLSHGSQEFISIVNCSQFEVMYNRVHEPGIWNYVEGNNSGVGGEGIDAKEASHHGSIHHNYVYNLSRQGMYVDAWDSNETGNIDIYNNIVHDTQHGLAVAGEADGTVKNIRVFNNLFYNNRFEGVILYSWGKNGRKDNIRIFNNTVYNNGNTGLDLGSELHENIIVVNNILYKNGKGEKPDYKSNKARNVTDANNLIGVDPKFENVGLGDFRPKSGSPAIDAGVKVEETSTDLYDSPRVSGKAMDVGAFEYSR